MRLPIFLNCFLSIILGLASRPFARGADESLPNIILCMGDDHGWDETAYNGHPILKTPVLDEMAASGLRLQRFYSAHPSCSPTRGSVITGRHPNRYGTFVPNCSIRPEEIGIAQILHQAGYASAHFGKWHLGPVKKTSPTNPGAFGFDQWLSHDNFFELNPILSRNGNPPQKFQGESSEVVVDETIRFIAESQKKQKPFFAVVWFGSPHEPYSGLQKDLDLYKNLPKELSQTKVKLTSNETGKPTKRPLDKVLQERFAEITAMDRAIGKLRTHLKNEGLRDNTILWYCGDNGVPPSGRYATTLRGQKALVYEGGVRVPGLIEWPKQIKQARVSQVPTVTSDMLPTICDLVGQPLPQRPLDGVSLKPLLDGKMKKRSSPIGFWNYNTRVEAKTNPKPYIATKLQEGTTPLVKQMAGRYTRNFRNFHHPVISPEDYSGARAFVGDRYKLVVDAVPGKKSSIELFDLVNDQAEENNLAKSKPEVVREMQNQLKAWQDSVLKSLTGADY
jgi:arylsulfatase A-like enzyme